MSKGVKERSVYYVFLGRRGRRGTLVPCSARKDVFEGLVRGEVTAIGLVKGWFIHRIK